MSFDLVHALVRTQALRVAAPGQLFWYTSGTVGPYYINTHFLFGGPEAANDLLEFIQREKDDHQGFPARLYQRVARQYAEDPVYRATMDLLVRTAEACAPAGTDFISGGERRDWFFSAALAARLERPHLLLYKDQQWVLAGPWGHILTPPDLDGCSTVHAADLVTEASSYTRTWIPAVRRAGGRMVLSVNVVDRGQGGMAAIEAAGVKARALIRVDRELFDRLLAEGVVDPTQHEVLCAYHSDPAKAMRAFLEQHPDFLRDSLASADVRTASRARLLVRDNPYGLDLAKLI